MYGFESNDSYKFRIKNIFWCIAYNVLKEKKKLRI